MSYSSELALETRTCAEAAEDMRDETIYYVRFDRQTRDYAAYRVIDGREQYIGSSASYSQALATARWGTAE
jgi:hypothetical protein